MTALDLDILQLIQAHMSPWLTMVMRVASWMFTPEFILPAIGVVLIVLFFKHKRAQEVLFMIILAGNLITVAMKPIIHSPRPTSAQATIIDHQKNASMPSGHSVAVITICGGVILVTHRRRRVPAWMLMVASGFVVLVGWSRVYLGAHWPSDVLAGWAIGLGWLWFSWRILKPRVERFERRHLAKFFINPDR